SRTPAKAATPARDRPTAAPARTARGTTRAAGRRTTAAAAATPLIERTTPSAPRRRSSSPSHSHFGCAASKEIDGINVEDDVDAPRDRLKLALRAPEDAVEPPRRRGEDHQHPPVAFADARDRRRHRTAHLQTLGVLRERAADVGRGFF